MITIDLGKEFREQIEWALYDWIGCYRPKTTNATYDQYQWVGKSDDHVVFSQSLPTGDIEFYYFRYKNPNYVAYSGQTSLGKRIKFNTKLSNGTLHVSIEGDFPSACKLGLFLKSSPTHHPLAQCDVDKGTALLPMPNPQQHGNSALELRLFVFSMFARWLGREPDYIACRDLPMPLLTM